MIRKEIRKTILEKSLPINLTNFWPHLDLYHPQHPMAEFHSLILSCRKSMLFSLLYSSHWFMQFHVLLILYCNKLKTLYLSVHYSVLTLLDGGFYWIKNPISVYTVTLFRNSHMYHHPYIPYSFCILWNFCTLWNPLLGILVLLSWVMQETLSHLWICSRAQILIQTAEGISKGVSMLRKLTI